MCCILNTTRKIKINGNKNIPMYRDACCSHDPPNLDVVMSLLNCGSICVSYKTSGSPRGISMSRTNQQTRSKASDTFAAGICISHRLFAALRKHYMAVHRNFRHHSFCCHNFALRFTSVRVNRCSQLVNNIFDLQQGTQPMRFLAPSPAAPPARPPDKLRPCCFFPPKRAWRFHHHNGNRLQYID